MQPAELDILREGIVAIARAAAQEILVVYGGEFAVQHKDDDSPVTAADLAAHRCIVAAVNEAAMEPLRGSRIPHAASRRDTVQLLWRAALRVPARHVDFSVLCMPPVHRGLPLPVGGYAGILEPLGVPVHVWTIDQADDARRLRARGVRGIISNDPAAIMGR